jgi:ornithine carbamoyltransferase
VIRHFLDLSSAGQDNLRSMLAEAHRRKAARNGSPKGAPDADAPLAGHVVALIFEKPSTRTRVSFDLAMRQLGGRALVLSAADMQLGRGETVADTARVLSGYVDAIMLRTGAHETIEELARHATVPVINGLTDLSHPCQALADVMTVEELVGPVTQTCWAYLGDGNNVANSLIEASGLLGFELRLAVPPDYDPDPAAVATASARGGQIDVVRDPVAAVSDAQVVVTDTWVSMGQSADRKKLDELARYQVNADIMARAAPNAVFLHCLPAHRGEEVTSDVMDGTQSAVWREAENRLHAQKAILLWCLGKLN